MLAMEILGMKIHEGREIEKVEVDLVK